MINLDDNLFISAREDKDQAILKIKQVVQKNLENMKNGISDVKGFIPFLPTVYDEIVYEARIFDGPSREGRDNFPLEIDKLELFLHALDSIMYPDKHHDSSSQQHQESEKSDETPEKSEKIIDINQNLDQAQDLLEGTLGKVSQTIRIKDIFSSSLSDYAIIYLENLYAFQVNEKKQFRLRKIIDAPWIYKDILVIARSTSNGLSNLQYLTSKKINKMQPKYSIFDFREFEADGEFGDAPSNFGNFSSYLEIKTINDIERLQNPDDITKLIKDEFTWSKNPPTPSITYNKSQSLIVTYTIFLAFITLASYNAYTFYTQKRELLQEMMRGPNKLILTDADLEFENEDSNDKTPQKPGQTDKKQAMKKKVTPDIVVNDTSALNNGSNADNKDNTTNKKTKRRKNKGANKKSTSLARLNDNQVWIKKFNKFELKKITHAELKHLREMRHENLNRFSGFYNEIQSSGLIFNYCTRNSLFDLLKKKEYNLDWTFKSSLLLDLVRGMNYIHKSQIKFHGKLKSTNCVVDSRFTLKITDYGLHRIKEAQKLEFLDNREESNRSEDLLWTAPEILRLKEKIADQENNANKNATDDNKKQTESEKAQELDDKKFATSIHGSQKGDIYAFGIIGSEICTRLVPFGMYKPKFSNSHILKKLKRCPPIFRPHLNALDCPFRMRELLKQCWAQKMDLRPDFSSIEKTINDLLEDKKANIVDNMMKVLEEYSSHLEDIVAERTADLEIEKKKSEELLCRMLPPSVAKELTAGKIIPPESFSMSTIYFSDICGFTTISAASSPLEVVDLLNDLYTMFDSIIDSYEVYKVETIGDAYMVSSGIPKRIGDRHASEMALMSLDILSGVGSFVMRHLPRVPMRIRIGLHSGPAVSGIVGKKMPRYCLFGDTINTASRMESTGLPQRIHISPTTYDFLLQDRVWLRSRNKKIRILFKKTLYLSKTLSIIRQKFQTLLPR